MNRIRVVYVSGPMNGLDGNCTDICAVSSEIASTSRGIALSPEEECNKKRCISSLFSFFYSFLFSFLFFSFPLIHPMFVSLIHCLCLSRGIPSRERTKLISLVHEKRLVREALLREIRP